MSGSVEGNQVRRAAIVKAWRNWLLMFVPLFAVICLASAKFGFGLIFPILIGLLVAGLLYQRFVNRRSWRSIMWGVHISGE
jgi:predicted membrane metal-binding protein